MGIGFIPNGEPFGKAEVPTEQKAEEVDFLKIWQHELEQSSDASREATEEYSRFFHSH